MPVGGPPPELDSYVQKGEALKASKREAAPKMSFPTRVAREDPRKKTWQTDDTWKPGNRCSEVGLMIERLVSHKVRDFPDRRTPISFARVGILLGKNEERRRFSSSAR